MPKCVNDNFHLKKKKRTKDLDKKNDRFRLNGKMMWEREEEKKKRRR